MIAEHYRRCSDRRCWWFSFDFWTDVIFCKLVLGSNVRSGPFSGVLWGPEDTLPLVVAPQSVGRMKALACDSMAQLISKHLQTRTFVNLFPFFYNMRKTFLNLSSKSGAPIHNIFLVKKRGGGCLNRLHYFSLRENNTASPDRGKIPRTLPHAREGQILWRT